MPTTLTLLVKREATKSTLAKAPRAPAEPPERAKNEGPPAVELSPLLPDLETRESTTAAMVLWPLNQRKKVSAEVFLRLPEHGAITVLDPRHVPLRKWVA